MSEFSATIFMIREIKHNLAKAGLWGRYRFNISKENKFVTNNKENHLTEEQMQLGNHIIYDTVILCSCQTWQGRVKSDVWLDKYTDTWFEFFTNGESQ